MADDGLDPVLERAVAALKSGKQADLERPMDAGPEVELHLPALIPEDYVPDVHLRLVLYKRIASTQTREELDELRAMQSAAVVAVNQCSGNSRSFFEPQMSFWASAYGGSGTIQGNGSSGAATTTAQIYGFATGIDYQALPNTIVGLALAGGGTNWAGGSYDPESHTVYTYSQTNPLTIGGIIPNPDHKMGEFDYVHVNMPSPPGVRVCDLTVDGLPLIKPPYGRITAYDMNRGDIAWQVANGDTPPNLVDSIAAGPWHTIASGLPDASCAVSSRPTSASKARSCIGPWPPGK